MRRALAASAALLSACAILTGCAGASTDDRGGPAKQTVSVVLDWTPNTNHSGIYLAMARGYYDQAGIDVEILPYSEAGSGSVLLSKGADFAFEGAYSVIGSRARGDAMTMVFNLQQQSSQGIAVRADNAFITRPADLDGKLFATWGASEGAAKVRAMIRNDGGEGNVETVLLGTSAYAAVYNGTADFAEGLTTWEGIEADLEGTPLKWFMPADYGVETTPAELGLATTPAYLTENPDLARRFIQATQKGYADAVADPAGAVDALIDANPDASIDRELAAKSQEMLASRYWKDASGSVGHADLDRWQSYIDYLEAQGLLEDHVAQGLVGGAAGAQLEVLAHRLEGADRGQFDDDPAQPAGGDHLGLGVEGPVGGLLHQAGLALGELHQHVGHEGVGQEPGQQALGALGLLEGGAHEAGQLGRLDQISPQRHLRLPSGCRRRRSGRCPRRARRSPCRAGWRS